MDSDQQDSPVFRSDEINTSKSHKDKNDYFVNVIKNPVLRWILRAKKPEEEPEPKETPKIVKAPEKPKPQFRVTIRISTLKLETEQKKHQKTVTVLSIFLSFFVLLSVFLVIYHL